MLLLKLIHVSAVSISFFLFTVRAYSVLTHKIWHRKRFFRVMPHINDTLLLLSAIGLAIALKQYPFIEAWLTVKLVLLLLYIVVGLVFMRLARTGIQRISLFVLALMCFLYMVSVAMTHQAQGVFSYFTD